MSLVSTGTYLLVVVYALTSMFGGMYVKVGLPRDVFDPFIVLGYTVDHPSFVDAVTPVAQFPKRCTASQYFVVRVGDYTEHVHRLTFYRDPRTGRPEVLSTDPRWMPVNTIA